MYNKFYKKVADAAKKEPKDTSTSNDYLGA